MFKIIKTKNKHFSFSTSPIYKKNITFALVYQNSYKIMAAHMAATHNHKQIIN